MRLSRDQAESPHPFEPIRAPILAADAMMEEEKAVRIVFVLHRRRP